MEVTNCKDCGRLFNFLTGPRLCPACVEKLEKKFMEVKDYIRENRNTTIDEVSKEMEVSVKQIKQWVREERLEFSQESGSIIECENCGVAIATGRFCQKCKNDMQKNLTTALHESKMQSAMDESKKEKYDSAKWRILDRKKN